MKNQSFLLTLILGITIAVLFPTLQNQWTNLDDTIYIIDNPLVKSLSWENIKKIFTTFQVNGSYNPLVLLSWALDYQFVGLNPQLYHITNLALHLLVTVLVFYFIAKLSKNSYVAFGTSLLFGIHPMHVEAVAWITARKDLLYALFYLLGLLTYLFYLEKSKETNRYKMLVLCFAFFFLALLSKAVAVTFPVILLIIDYFKFRRDVKQLLLEKVLFFVLSALFVYLSIQAQDKGGALQFREFYSILDSLSVGFYGYFTYLIKLIVPYKLSALHPYPTPSGTPNPLYFWWAAVPVLALVLFCIYNFKKSRALVFGFAFFFITLIPVIQVLSFAVSFTADRFTYIPYIGLFFLLSLGIVTVVKKFPKYKKWALGISGIYIIGLGVITFSYSKEWKNSETVWSKIINYYPDYFVSYVNRAAHRIENGRLDEALEDCKIAICLKPDYYLAYYNIGYIYQKKGVYNKAVDYYSQTIDYNKDAYQAYQNRGIMHDKMMNNREALIDFNTSIELKPTDPIAYLNRASHYNQMGEWDDVIKDASKALSLSDEIPQAFYLRGKCFFHKRKFKEGLLDLNKALALAPEMADGYTQRGNLYMTIRQYKKAFTDYKKSIEIDADQFQAHVNLGIILMNTSRFKEALYHYAEAERIDPKNRIVYFNRGLGYKINKQYDKALENFKICLSFRTGDKRAFLEVQSIENILKNKK